MAHAPDRPNILLITTDQQRFDTLHAAGNQHIFTPHLNWLADSGVRFSRAYTETPVCMPARATIMCGLPGYQHGTVGNSHTEPLRGRPTIPSLLTEAGYQTRAQGKMHFHPMRNHFGFEEMELSTDYYRFMRKYFPGLSGAEHGLGQNEMEPVLGSAPAEMTLSRWVSDRCIDFLETRDEERPFFLWASYSPPHPPFDPSQKFWDLYDGMPMPDPVYGDWSQRWEDVPAGFRRTTAELNEVHRFGPAQLRQSKRAYYATITEVDYALGRLFARMREMSLFRDTWVIFTSDHGEMLGDHWIGGKSIYLEGSAHVPFLMRPAGEWDEEPTRGTVCQELVGLQDIFPTCLGIAGLDVPEESGASGFDLRDLAQGASGRERIVGQCNEMFGVVEGPWKYLYTSEGGAELLFNLAEDPYEQRNLAPSDPRRVADLRARLTQELAQADSPYIDNGQLRHTEAVDPHDVRRWRSWPGFHSTSDEKTDLLH